MGQSEWAGWGGGGGVRDGVGLTPSPSALITLLNVCAEMFYFHIAIKAKDTYKHIHVRSRSN